MEDNISKRLANSARLCKEEQLEQALQELSGVLVLDPVNKQALSAIADIFFQGGKIAESNINHIDAYRMYARAITFNGDLSACREKLLSLIPRYLESREIYYPESSHPEARGTGNLVLGIGTGRSGSTSFTRLLSLQPGTYASHEHPPHLPWIVNRDRFRFHTERFKILLSILPCVADVSHWWLPYLEQLLDELPGTRIVVLKRDRQETIRSFESILGQQGTGQNHWVEHRGIGWQYSRWDPCFPKYPVSNRKEAIGLYWDEYYAKAQELYEKYPENILLCRTEELDKTESQARILKHCGYSKPLTVPALKFNSGNADDGAMQY